MTSEETPCALYLQACKNAGVKTPNPALVSFFYKCPTFASVDELDLSGNYIGNRGIMALLEMLPQLPCVRHFNLSDQKLYNTDLSDDSVKGNAVIDRLVEVCETHPAINSLDLSRNPIGNYAGRKLLALAKANGRLCRIELTDTRVDFDLRGRIARLCQDNTERLWNEYAPQHDIRGGGAAAAGNGAFCADDGDGANDSSGNFANGDAFAAATAAAVDETPFGEGPQWTPKPAVADLTSLGGGRARRQTVRVEGIDPEKAKHYVAPVVRKSPEEMELICNLLMHNVLFSFLTSKDIRTVAGAMYRAEFKRDECIIEYGQRNCDKLYIVQSGQADIIKEGQKVFLKTEGSAVGELELLYDTPAVATVKVCSDVLLAWVLDRDTYRNLVMGTCIRRREMYVSMLANVPVLASLDDYERMQVADALSSDEFEPGQYILRYGDEGEWLYIIVEGTVEVIGRDADGHETTVCTFTNGDHVGELEFLNNHRNVADVVAVTHVTTAKLNRRHFEMCMGPVMDVLKRDSSSSKYKYYQQVLQTQQQQQ